MSWLFSQVWRGIKEILPLLPWGVFVVMDEGGWSGFSGVCVCVCYYYYCWFYCYYTIY